jgi:hypothetical protein
VLCFSVDCLLVGLGWILLDNGLQICPKHVQVD